MLATLLSALVLGGIPATRPSAISKLVYDHELPNVDGKSIRGVHIEYSPGASYDLHAHISPGFIYATVLQGSIRDQINHRPVATYREGDSFSSYPGDHHDLNENASPNWPARLLCVFVVDTGQTIATNEGKYRK